MKWLKVSLLSFIVLTLFVSIAPAQQSDGLWYAKKGIADHSNAATAGSIAWIAANIGSGYGVIVLSGGVFTITGDLTLEKTVTLKVLPGSSIYSADNDDLVIKGQLEAGAYPIFSGVSVDLKDANFPLAYAEWFGAVGDDDTGDDGVAIQACAVAAKRVDLVQGKTYCAKTKINLPSSSVMDGHNATLKGHADLDDYVLAIEGDVDLRYVNTEANFGLAKTKVTIRDLSGNLNGSPGFLLILSAYYVTLERISILANIPTVTASQVIVMIRNSFHVKLQTCSLHGKDQEDTYGLYLSSDGDSKGFRVLNNIEMDTSIVQHCKYNIYTDLNEKTGTTHLECGLGVVSATLNSRGSGYVVGDLLNVIPKTGGAGGAQILVTEIQNAGEIANGGFALVRKGFNYSVDNAYETFQHDSTKLGSGAKFNITAVKSAIECAGLPANTLTFLNNAILDKKGKGTPHWGYAWYFAKGNIGNLNLIGNKVERCLAGIFVHSDMGRFQVTIDGLNTSNTLHVFDFAEADPETLVCFDDDEEDPEQLATCPSDGPLAKVELRGIKVQTTKGSPDPPEGDEYTVFRVNNANVIREDYSIELLDVEDYSDTGEAISGRYASIWDGTGTGSAPSVVTVTDEGETYYYRCIVSHTSSLATKPRTGENADDYWVKTSSNTGWTVSVWADATAYVRGRERGKMFNAFPNIRKVEDTNYHVKYSQDNTTYNVELISGVQTVTLPEIKWSGMRLRFNVLDGRLGRLKLELSDNNRFTGSGTVYGAMVNGDALYSPGGTDGSQMGASVELVSDFYNGWWFINSITGTWSIYTP